MVPSLAGAWLRRGFLRRGFRLGVRGCGVEVCRFLAAFWKDVVSWFRWMGVQRQTARGVGLTLNTLVRDSERTHTETASRPFIQRPPLTLTHSTRSRRAKKKEAKIIVLSPKKTTNPSGGDCAQFPVSRHSSSHLFRSHALHRPESERYFGLSQKLISDFLRLQGPCARAKERRQRIERVERRRDWLGNRCGGRSFGSLHGASRVTFLSCGDKRMDGYLRDSYSSS
ncbi:hypothetical protein F5144DRAFT_203271 [Chaetomium tenue]|uniref:Uncharacterized protein n=1 Tax=Chaetomium tenue TaxID=1854479 RepID=A0ACB7PFE0_9PEZI|nr:hypothetical protein F5144DRAFT_203271 [Chaetomium globosum]